jgi:hypothetical protein
MKAMSTTFITSRMKKTGGEPDPRSLADDILQIIQPRRTYFAAENAILKSKST